jgi:hypothetical protein
MAVSALNVGARGIRERRRNAVRRVLDRRQSRIPNDAYGPFGRPTLNRRSAPRRVIPTPRRSSDGPHRPVTRGRSVARAARLRLKGPGAGRGHVVHLMFDRAGRPDYSRRHRGTAPQHCSHSSRQRHGSLIAASTAEARYPCAAIQLASIANVPASSHHTPVSSIEKHCHAERPRGTPRPPSPSPSWQRTGGRAHAPMAAPARRWWAIMSGQRRCAAPTTGAAWSQRPGGGRGGNATMLRHLEDDPLSRAFMTLARTTAAALDGLEADPRRSEHLLGTVARVHVRGPSGTAARSFTPRGRVRHRLASGGLLAWTRGRPATTPGSGGSRRARDSEARRRGQRRPAPSTTANER